MTTTHTPGPWHTIGPAIFRNDKPACELVGDELSRIATVVTRRIDNLSNILDQKAFDDESDANARLIAAAPALLEALQGLIACDCLFDSAQTPDVAWRYQVAYAAAKSALDLATK